LVVTDVSGQSLGPFFEGQAVQEELAAKHGPLTSQTSEELIEIAAEAWNNGA